jgi:hypothetical protein
VDRGLGSGADHSPVVSDSGSETGAASRAHMRPGAVGLTALSALISTYGPHQVCYPNVRVVRDEEAAGSNPTTPTRSEGTRLAAGGSDLLSILHGATLPAEGAGRREA